MYIYCLAHVLLAYYPTAPPGLPPLSPVMPELCHLDKGKYKHNAKKQTQIGRLLHQRHLLFILCYNVHLRPIKIGEAYLITPGRPLALALDLKRQQWPTTSRSEQRDAIAGERDRFCLVSTKLKRWLVDRHTSLSTDYGGKSFHLGLSVCLCSFGIFLCAFSLFFLSFTQMCKWEKGLDIFFK